MKHFFIICFLCISNLNAQKYIFNTLTCYSKNYGMTKSYTYLYTNYNDDTYWIFLKKTEMSFTASLYDSKNLKKHSFDVIEEKIENEDFYKFKYKNTSKFNFYNENNYKKHLYVFETIEVKDSIRKVRLSVYRNSKKRKPLIEYELEINHSNYNMFPAFRISCIHPYEFVKRLNPNENGIVIRAKGNSISGNLYEFKLEEVKETYFELVIDEN